MAHFDQLLNPAKVLPLIEHSVIPDESFKAILKHYDGSLHFKAADTRNSAMTSNMDCTDVASLCAVVKMEILCWSEIFC